MVQLRHISWNWTQKYYYFENFGISQEQDLSFTASFFQ